MVLRNVEIGDAEFIVGLRRTDGKSEFISETSPDTDKQRRYIEAYLRSQNSAYFVICDLSMRPLGTVRLYDPVENSFSWGSWILSTNCPKRAGIESAMMVYAYALGLGFRKAHFSVQRGNVRVWRFHERFGALRTGESRDELFYSIDEVKIHSSMKRFGKYLPRGIEVTPL